MVWVRDKHIATTLRETDQGAACAGICACLSVSYDSFFASKVLKALADASLAPNTLTPALYQWGALMNVCSGVVTDSTFSNTVEDFSRLPGHQSRGRTLPLHEPTTANALACALLEFSKVKQRRFEERDIRRWCWLWLACSCGTVAFGCAGGDR